ncbi:MAG: wax ester/triacylglycerol synthase family O-acyltransferase [Candidatus Dormibacteraeota bacterium]|uniref:diacylglycerol O-acyltransferase n=1 Tax=Candidatus Aeolococcus gillhamiae TaxID=3127015 RepID=A0A2W6AS07_9BACT|nr:wax ester/triacylglycerol synthase family O-acyltransferase [Candidatus Dormibacteraeota bacterium]PZR80591.1 MAG: wax ester/triacylglycerol synthase family O-acyltransferase [Candidatus Dormibacter sp. RRmetagenome_bin12]
MQGAQKLTPLDASFLHLETPRTHMHIGGVAIFERSPLGTGRALYDGLAKAIAPRLDLMPRYRQKLSFVPLSLDTPVWVDDPDFDMSNHLVRAALPKPGGDEELRELIGRVFSRQLDRRRPLWEIYIVEGLRNGRWALLTKSHHAMVDGISNLELATILLDVEPEPAKQPFGVSRWEARESPTGMGLFINSLRDRLTRPARVLSAARAVAGQPARLANALRDTASGLASMAEHMGAPKSPINGKTGPARAFAYSRFPLRDFRDVKTAFGGTINDIVLAAVAGGLRHFLVARGIDPDDESSALQALCPVSIRDTSERTALGNRLAMLLVKLPIAEADPARRVAKVRTTVDALKARKQAVGADFLLNLAGFAPATLHAMVARASLRQIAFNLIVTNVPGPQFPLYCQGARLVEVFPIAFLYDGQELAVAIFSYDGMLNFGYLVDAQGIPDVDVFAECVEEGLRELVEAAGAATSDGLATTRTRSARPAPKRATAAKGARKGTATRKAAATRKTTTRHRGAA